MIKGVCHSNSDEFRASQNWPTLFVAVPQRGEYIENSDGLKMKVWSVTHMMRRLYNTDDITNQKEPYIEIELVKI